MKIIEDIFRLLLGQSVDYDELIKDIFRTDEKELGNDL